MGVTPGKATVMAKELLQLNTRAQLCSGRIWTMTTGLSAKQKVLGCFCFLERKTLPPVSKLWNTIRKNYLFNL